MVQVGTTGFPIIVKPRISGSLVTQTQIKNDFSNAFVDDSATPINFTLEYREVNGTVNEIFWDPLVSTDDFIFFMAPDSLYAEIKEWTVTVFWEIGGEKIYSLKPFHLSVDNVHDQ